MLYWTSYIKHSADVVGKRKKVDNTIYTFDIETTSYLVLDGKQLKASEYLNLNNDEVKRAEKRTCMYIWMFSINDIVYYGRTWDEFKEFLNRLEKDVPERKLLFVHNLAFEFQFLKSIFHFQEVTARKAHKVMTALMKDYNILIKCSYMMSNCALKNLPDLFKLPVKKMVGDLDYDLIRHSNTELTEKELGYCENDCLVVYHYILYELATYERVDKIPTTSTGHVRRELQQMTMTDLAYKRVVRNAISIDPVVYNRLQSCFMGGYTHSSWVFTGDVINDVDSYDECSAYPYVLTTCKFPSKEFKRANIKRREEMMETFAYIIVVKFINLKCKYYNNFISMSKCKNIKGGKYDNGRVMEAKELEIVLTDVDFYFILDAYDCEYEIQEAWYSLYNYLPKKFIEFVLDKYVAKTKYKGVVGKELDYQKEKNKFNALYGMSVTNTIRDNVIYNDDTGLWSEEEITNDDIKEKLIAEKKKGFLSFSYGCWCTAWARDFLLRRIIALDDYVIYTDTDSLKLRKDYNKKIIDDYNKTVEEKIRFVSKVLHIPFEKYAPEDSKGEKHLLGIFEYEGKMESFITQGAKKYADIKWKKLEKVRENDEHVLEVKDGKAKVLEITVAGVPKSGAKALNRLEDFKDDFVFTYNDTGKNLLMYIDEMNPIELVDYTGKSYIVKDKSGCCLLPTTYVLGKALEYAELLTDSSSKRAIYKE